MTLCAAPSSRRILLGFGFTLFVVGVSAVVIVSLKQQDGLSWAPIENAGARTTPAFPLKRSENHRYLEDQQGQPFFLHGDTAWSIITGVTKQDAEFYLEDRRRQGFNAVIVNLIEHKFNGPANRDGEQPFLVEGDLATPNERYFNHAEWVIRKAADKGILVLLAPCYLGYEGLDEGWFQEVMASGVEKARRYGEFVGRRFKLFDNIIWMLGGDRRPGAAMPHVRAMAEAIAKQAPRQLMTAHLAPEVSTRDEFPRETWITLNLTYTYNLVHAAVLRDYYRSPAMPVILAESHYEGEHGSTVEWIRRQAYAAILNGACGHVMGNRPIWLFDPGWRESLSSPANLSMRHLRAFFLSRRWYELQPDLSLVTKGYGNPRGSDFVSAARSEDNAAVVVYLPSARTIEVDLTSMRGTHARTHWFDVRSGQIASAGLRETRSGHRLYPPGRGDWILVFDSSESERDSIRR